jgi:hypothetical protein
MALVLPLGLDTFAVVAALGTIGVSPARRLRISLLFTASEAGMPLIGLGLGAPLGHAIDSAADYLAIGVSLAFGLSPNREPGAADDRAPRSTSRLAPLAGRRLKVLCLAARRGLRDLVSLSRHEVQAPAQR